VRIEGYGGMSVIDIDDLSDNKNNANAGGTGSAGCLLWDIFHIQGDVFGDWNDLNKIAPGFNTGNISNVGGGGHIGIADPDLGAFEVNGAYNNIMVDTGNENGGLWRIGGEGELYLNPVTLGVHAGYLKATDDFGGSGVLGDDNGYYARGMIRFYPTENIKLEGLGGVGANDNDTIPQARILAEFRPHSWPVGFFVRGEGAWDNHINQYFATGGVRVYLFDEPATLRETDRRYFREACVQFLVGTRTC
jgi:hypothetical protein